MVATLELDNQITTCCGPSDAKGAHGSLRTAVDESETLNGRHPRTDQFAKPDLSWAGGPERAARSDGYANSLNDPGVRVAKHEWTERADVIDVAVAISVPDERSLAPHHNRRFAADCPICSDWTADSAWEKLGGSLAPGGAVAAPAHVTSNRDVSIAIRRR